MKYHLRVPTEMYAYIEAEYEGDTPGAVAAYRELTDAVKVKPDEVVGLSALEFNRVLDKYLWQNNIDVGDFEQLNLAKQAVLQEIKKSKARNK